VRQDYTILRAILDTAVRDELLGRNPAAAITRPKVEAAEAAYLTPAQVGCSWRPPRSSRYAAVFTLLVNTGFASW
jgi:integrase